MRLLSYWISETSYRVLPLQNYYKTEVLDQSINTDNICEDRIEMDRLFGIKKIFKSDSNLLYKSFSGKKYLIGAIHSQGGAKMFIHCYSKGQRSFLAKFIAYIEYWINRVYEKICRTFGYEKRYSWK